MSSSASHTMCGDPAEVVAQLLIEWFRPDSTTANLQRVIKGSPSVCAVGFGFSKVAAILLNIDTHVILVGFLLAEKVYFIRLFSFMFLFVYY